jgi:CopG family nickel-responsive transcriptional regulator
LSIISVSIDSELLQQLDALAKDMGFSGRSDALRAAIRLLIRESGDALTLKGEATCLLLVLHGEEAEGIIAKTSHRFEDVVVTQLHSKPEKGKCLELFVLQGKAERIIEMDKAMRASRKVRYSKIVSI